MSDTAVVSARQEQIDQWVLRDALHLTLANVGTICDDLKDVEDIASEVASELFDELWPGGDDEPGAVANARSCALAASILVRLTTDEARDYLLRESARLSALAAKNLEGVVDDA
jgi:hypothetical protein